MKPISNTDLPNWLSRVAPEYLLLIEQGIVSFRPWMLLDSDLVELRNQGLAKRYPSRELFAFASRTDNDDVACWEKGFTNKVVIIHDFASRGYEQSQVYETFWEWFHSAIRTMEEFENLD